MNPDILVPDFNSSQRRSNLVVATFNLTATIVGGGVLSLPLAFAKCGVILGTLLMIIAALLTERTLYLLCLCARHTGANTYGEVGEAAFGKYMEYFISFILATFLMFVLVGYMVLIKDIWTSIIEIVFGIENLHGDYVLLAVVLFMSPFLVQRTLHALRYNCYVAFGSVSVLCLALCQHAMSSPLPSPLLLWTTNWSDILFAFPIITLSFMSIFNVLPIQRSLIKPSRGRLLFVVDGAMGSCFLLTLIFGLAGYLYSGATTKGNILESGIEDSDWVFFLGRLGCGITIMLAMAMMMLPCRESVLEVIDVFVNGPHVVPIDQETIPLIADPSKAASNKAKRPSIADNKFIHYATTFSIAAICYICAIHAPGVAFVWSLCGSFLAYLIAFILPCACYLEIQRKHPERSDPGWVWFSCILIFASTIAAVACTIHTFSTLV
jgi:amino acid permease